MLTRNTKPSLFTFQPFQYHGAHKFNKVNLGCRGIGKKSSDRRSAIRTQNPLMSTYPQQNVLIQSLSESKQSTIAAIHFQTANLIMSNPGGAVISAEQLKARYVGTGKGLFGFTFAVFLV